MPKTKQRLDDLASLYFHGGYRANPRSEDAGHMIVDRGAALSGFIGSLQAGGNDLSSWTEADWRRVLDEQFAVDEDHMVDYLEDVAGWGVVDETR